MISNSRSLISCMCIIFIGGIGYIISSILSHGPANALYACMLCTNNQMHEDGEYLYNHYLFVLCIIWIALMVIVGYVVKERTERVTQKTIKRETDEKVSP